MYSSWVFGVNAWSLHIDENVLVLALYLYLKVGLVQAFLLFMLYSVIFGCVGDVGSDLSPSELMRFWHLPGCEAGEGV